MMFPVCLAYPLSNIKVGDAIQCCPGSGQTNGHNDPPAQHLFDHSIKEVFDFPKLPQSPEAELHYRQNAAPAAMLLTDDKKRAPEIGQETS